MSSVISCQKHRCWSGTLIKSFSCTPDRNCHTFCLGDKIASHPGVLTQAKCAKKITQNLEINQILGVVVQEKESSMVFCSRWKFPTLGMTSRLGSAQHGHPLGWKLPSRTEPHIRFLYYHVVICIQYCQLSHDARKPDFCICENCKDADQLFSSLL